MRRISGRAAWGLGASAVLLGAGIGIAGPALAQTEPAPDGSGEPDRCPYECPYGPERDQMRERARDHDRDCDQAPETMPEPMRERMREHALR